MSGGIYIHGDQRYVRWICGYKLGEGPEKGLTKEGLSIELAKIRSKPRSLELFANIFELVVHCMEPVKLPSLCALDSFE